MINQLHLSGKREQVTPLNQRPPSPDSPPPRRHVKDPGRLRSLCPGATSPVTMTAASDACLPIALSATGGYALRMIACGWSRVHQGSQGRGHACVKARRRSPVRTGRSPVQVRPPSGDLHVCLVHRSPAVPTRPGGRDELGCEPLSPPVDSDVVDFHASLGHQLLDIAIGQAVADVPPHRRREHLARDPEPATPKSNPKKTPPECPAHYTRSMQQCLPVCLDWNRGTHVTARPHFVKPSGSARRWRGCTRCYRVRVQLLRYGAVAARGGPPAGSRRRDP